MIGLLVVVAVVAAVTLSIRDDGDEGGPRGLLSRRAGAMPGATLYSPLELQRTYLIGLDGDVLHSWSTSTQPALSQYLLPDGHLLRTGDLERDGRFRDGHGAGGRIEELDWSGDVVWRFDYADDEVMQHHDVEPLPNGNVLFVAWEHVTGEEAVAAGRDPDLLPDGELWPDTIVEYSPAQQRIVWRWRVWDHLVQDRDPAKPHYGRVADHPEKIDVNFVLAGNNGDADWNHVNAVTYNAATDEIMISSRSFSEIWIIDHTATTAEAAGPAGDLKFRFGNPRAHGAGSFDDQQLFVQHDPVWIPAGHPGAGQILVFSNGLPKVRPYSSVEQIRPAVDADGDYVLGPDGRFAASIQRVYPRQPSQRSFSPIISGAQRLANGDTLITYGTTGRMREVTPAGRTVWDYENPRYAVHDDTPARTGAGFVIEPWWVFRAKHYPPSYPGLAALARAG